MNRFDEFDKLEKKIDESVDDSIGLSTNSIDEFLKQIESISAETMKVDSGIVTATFTDAQKAQTKAMQAFNAMDSKLKTELEITLDSIDKSVSNFYGKIGEKEDFTDDQLFFFEKMRENTINNLSLISETLAVEVYGEIYKTILSNGKYTDFLDILKNKISRVSANVDVFVRDTSLNYYQNIHLLKADIAGIDSFLYAGNIMADSRAWCIVRVGKIFTKKQIESWNNDKWKGKSCQPLICRGGYNCRHHWRPTRPEWIDDIPKRTGSWYKENPDTLSEKLLNEIKIEEGKL